MHCEASAFVESIEAAERVLGLLEEIYFPEHTTTELLMRQELGKFQFPCEGLVDAKSLYDVLVAVREPRPADDSSLLWLKWSRERLQSGAVRALSWCSTQDMLCDCCTKPGVDTSLARRVMMDVLLQLSYSVLRSGRLLDVHKGLPLPKTQRDAVAAKFCEAFWNSKLSLEAFMEGLGSATSLMDDDDLAADVYAC